MGSWLAMDREALLRKIHEILESGRYERRNHFGDRQASRNISDSEIFQVIDEGVIIDGPTWNNEHSNWKVNIEAEVSCGDSIVVSLGVELEDEHLFMITAFAR